MKAVKGIIAALVIAGAAIISSQKALEAEVSNVKVNASADREETKKEANPVVIMETSEGTIKIELWADKAPGTVKNFLRYTDEKFYDCTIFHRVINHFIIQT